MSSSKDEEAALSLFDDSTISSLAHHARLETEVVAFEEILNNSIQHIMEGLPGGAENYDESTDLEKIGRIWISRFNNPELYGVDIAYTPSKHMKRMVDYEQTAVGMINLDTRKYKLSRPDGPIPDCFLKDITKTLNILGLKKVRQMKRGEFYV